MAKCTIKPKKEGTFDGVRLDKDMAIVINTDYSDPLRSSRSSIINAYKRQYETDVSKVLKPEYFEVELSK